MESASCCSASLAFVSLIASWVSVRSIAPLFIPPVYIAIVSVAERRWGQSWSGRLTAIPTQTSTVILLVALTEGPGLAAGVASGAILGVMSLSAFAVGYGLTCSKASWKGSVVVATIVFLASAICLVVIHATLAIDALVAVVVVCGSILGLRRIERIAESGRKKTVRLPVRMALALFLVIFVAVSVPVLGPIAAGTLAVFPIITAPMAVLNQQESGPSASRRYLEGLEWGLFGGIVFFFTLSVLLASQGILVAFTVAIQILVVTLLGSFLVANRLVQERRVVCGSD